MKRTVEAKRRAAEKESTRMEVERQGVVMKAERQAAAVELEFQISDLLQISEWFRLVQICSDWFRLVQIGLRMICCEYLYN